MAISMWSTVVRVRVSEKSEWDDPKRLHEGVRSALALWPSLPRYISSTVFLSTYLRYLRLLYSTYASRLFLQVSYSFLPSLFPSLAHLASFIFIFNNHRVQSTALELYATHGSKVTYSLILTGPLSTQSRPRLPGAGRERRKLWSICGKWNIRIGWAIIECCWSIVRVIALNIINYLECHFSWD